MTETADRFDSLCRTPHGQVFHCPEFRRLVIEFKGAYLVFRTGELFRFQRKLSQLAGCSWSRSRLEEDEFQITDAVGLKSLTLNLADLMGLAELMDLAATRLGRTHSGELLQCG